MHRAGQHTSAPTWKVSLFPTYKEERYLLRDVLITSGERMKQFFVDIRNPDMTQYKTHGKNWSLCLNFYEDDDAAAGA